MDLLRQLEMLTNPLGSSQLYESTMENCQFEVDDELIKIEDCK